MPFYIAWRGHFFARALSAIKVIFIVIYLDQRDIYQFIKKESILLRLYVYFSLF